jgi:asparagine synthetase B (glutamine-hydrolysing)
MVILLLWWDGDNYMAARDPLVKPLYYGLDERGGFISLQKSIADQCKTFFHISTFYTGKSGFVKYYRPE